MGKEPEMYSDSIRPKWIDASYELQPREILNIDRIVMGVVRHHAIAQKYFPTIPIPKGMRKHEMNVAVELEEPRFDDDFMTEDLDKVRRTPITHYLVAMHKDFALNMIDLDASRNNRYYDTKIDELNIREATLTIADYKERVLWRGYDILNRGKSAANAQGTIDTNVKSIISPATGTGTQNTFVCGAGANDGMDAAGDGPISVGKAMGSMIPDMYFGPYVWTMTPDVYTQLAQNFNTTTHISDIERMQSMIDLKGNKILEGMESTHYLINTTATADNGSILMFQRKTPLGEPAAVILESYPVSHYPTQQTALGIKGKVLWMGCGAVIRAEAFTLETAVNIVT
jgi:hypothetical protein